MNEQVKPKSVYVDRVWYIDDIFELKDYFSTYKETIYGENISFGQVLVITRFYYGILKFGEFKRNIEYLRNLECNLKNQNIIPNTRIYCKSEPNFYWIVKERTGKISDYEIFPIHVLDEAPLTIEEKIDDLTEKIDNLAYAAGYPKVAEIGEHFKELVEKQ